MSRLPACCGELPVRRPAVSAACACAVARARRRQRSAVGHPSAAEKVLNVYNWSDYIQPHGVADFEKQYGIHVNYDVFDSNEILETKLLAGHTSYDIVVPSASFLERQIQADVYQKLDKSLLPNLKNVDPQMWRGATRCTIRATSTASTTCGSPPASATTCTEIRAAHAGRAGRQLAHAVRPGGGRPNSRTAACRCSTRPRRWCAPCCCTSARIPTATRRRTSRRPSRCCMSIRPYVRYVDSSRYIDNLANGDICLAMGWSGDVKQAHDRAREAGKGVDIAYSHPQRGRDQLLRRAGDPGGCAARAQCAPVHQLPAAPGRRRAQLQPHQVRQCRPASHPAARSGGARTTRACTRRPRCARGSARARRGRRHSSAC